MGARQQLSSKFMIKTLIADYHAVVRRGLKQILRETPDIIASGEASDSCEVLDLVRKHSWDVLLLDISMPGRSGLDILREIKQIAPQLPVLVLSRHAEGKYISPSQAEKLVYLFEGSSEKPAHETLSNREYEVLRLIASGKTVTQIGKEISLSVKTVSTYRARILEKMNLQSSAELTHYAIKNRLVE